MGARKPQTFAKLQRERRVKEKRQLKLEKKLARKLEAEGAEGAEGTEGSDSPPSTEEEDTGSAE
jgi:hypothetical protein